MTNQLNLEEELRTTAITELNLTNEKNRLTNIIALIVFLLLLVLVYILFQNNRISKQKQRLSEQNEQIVIQKNTKLLAEKELETTYARLEGQDSERKRIAQDLHDRLGSMLSTVKLFFAAVDSKINEFDKENQNHFQKANDLLDEACDEVRRVSHDMESGILTKFGLQAELEALTSTIMETKQIKVELVTHGLNERLDNILEVKSYRIIQELVNNVLKHAKANKITIQLNRFNDVLNIMVEDDGVGFKPESINKRDGMGLNNVTSRVHGMNGTLDIDTDKGNGTTISIDIPCCT